MSDTSLTFPSHFVCLDSLGNTTNFRILKNSSLSDLDSHNLLPLFGTMVSQYA